MVLTFGGHDYTTGFERQLREAVFETTKEYRYLNYIVHLIGDVLIVSGRISHGNSFVSFVDSLLYHMIKCLGEL